MIPEKLYIPTSTLNFNNIMSSESISPAAFYTNRRFGYKRFEKVDPNNLDNLILLYDKYPVFDINDQELESYPLVIEIDTQLLPEDSIQENNGFYCTPITIYLNPFSTRIIFRTDAELITTLSKSEPSIESKLVPLYQNQFVALSDKIETFDWHPITINDLSDYNNIAVSFDIAINKLKGMLYGYLLGANESSSKEIVSLKRMLKELRNVLSAVLTSPDGRATQFQKQQLDNLYAGINQVLYTLSGVDQRIDEMIAEKIEKYQSPKFVEILKGEGVYQEWFKRQISQLKLRHHQITPFDLSYQSTDKFSKLDGYIDNIERVIQQYGVKSKLEISKIPVIQNRRIGEVPEQKEFLSTLFNEYMDEVWNGTEFLSSRYEFAKVGGKLFKESSGDNWDNSPARTYINSLLKNLNEYTELDINSTESDILKSFAAFCQKGEGDIDKLRDYLISNSIGDFCIAFALWGLIFGFAEMPKTLTNDLFEDKDGQYVSDCYKFIHKQLHNIELEGILDMGSKRNEKSIVKIASLDQEVTTIPEKLKLMFNCDAFKKLSSAAQEYFKKESLALYQGKIDDPYIELLKKLEYSKSKTNWNNAVKTLMPKTKKTTKNNNQKTLPLFSTTSTGNFLNDFDFLQSNEEFRSLVSAIKDWENDLKWFIVAHNPNHIDYKYYEDKPTDNESVIKQFIFLKKEKYKCTESFLRKTYLK